MASPTSTFDPYDGEDREVSLNKDPAYVLPHRMGLPANHPKSWEIARIASGGNYEAVVAAVEASDAIDATAKKLGVAEDDREGRAVIARDHTPTAVHNMADRGVNRRVRPEEKAARRDAESAVGRLGDADQSAEERAALGGDVIKTGRFRGLTRAQVIALHREQMAAAAHREAVGDRRHLHTALAGWLVWSIVVTIAGLEALLIAKPVSGLDWYEPLTWGTFAGVVSLFVVFTHTATTQYGKVLAIAEELVSGGYDVTGVATDRRGTVTAPTEFTTVNAEELPGLMHGWTIHKARTHRNIWGIGMAVLAMAYGAVVFVRVHQVASSRPGWAPGFPTLVALLLAMLTVGLLAMLVWMSFRSHNALRNDLEDTGVIVAETYTLDAALKQNAETGVFAADDDALLSRDHLAVAEVGRISIAEQASRVYLMTAVLQSLPAVPRPAQGLLERYEQHDDDVARSTLFIADGLRESVTEKIAAPVDYTPEHEVFCAWRVRTLPHQAPPNTVFIEDYRRQPFPAEGPTTPPRRRWWHR